MFESSRIFLEKRSFWALSYTQESLKLMPKPFPNGCIDYTEIGFESETHCQYQCVAGRSLALYGKSVFPAAILKPQNFTTISKYQLINDRSLQKEFDGWIEFCGKKCAAFNCDRHFFIPSLVDTRDSKSLVVFQLLDMNGLEIRGSFSPKINTIEFTAQILSISGVWLGLSCADILIYFFQLSYRRYRKYLANKRHKSQLIDYWRTYDRR